MPSNFGMTRSQDRTPRLMALAENDAALRESGDAPDRHENRRGLRRPLRLHPFREIEASRDEAETADGH